MLRPCRPVPGGLRVLALPRSHDAAPRGLKTRWRALLRLRGDLRLYLRGSRWQGHTARDLHESEASGRVNLLSESFSTILSVAQYFSFFLERGGRPEHAARARSSGRGRRASLACGPPRPLALAALLTRSPRRFFLAGGLLALGFVAVVVAAWRSIAFLQPPCRLPHLHSWQLYVPPAPNNGAPGVDGTAGPAVFLPLLAALSKRE